jgi:acyl-CoA thioester hydrolase
MPEVFTTRRRVEFCETDAAGIAHFSSFICYMEQAEHAFLRSLGTSVVQALDNAESSEEGRGWHLSWPRVHVECDYKGSARFEDELTIEVSVLKIGTKSVTYGFAFSKDDYAIAYGQVVAVCCRVKSGEPLKSMSVPEKLATQLRGYLSEVGD